MKKNNNKEKGFTNIELLLGVGIISVLSGSVYFLYHNTNDKRIASSETTNLNSLVSRLANAATASTYASLNKTQLNDYGIYYKSEFTSFDIQGLSPRSFQVNYSGLSARQCNDFALKTSSMQGDFKVSHIINGSTPNQNTLLQDVVSQCNLDSNTVNVVFSGMPMPVIASVAAGVPKPPPVYAGEGTINPAYPDRGDVPSNLGISGKNVANPNQPTPGAYTPPTYIVASNTTPTGNATNPGAFVRPTYPANNPLGPLTNPPDSGNEWVPATPPTPPRPPATAPPPPPPAPPPAASSSSSISVTFNQICMSEFAMMADPGVVGFGCNSQNVTVNITWNPSTGKGTFTTTSPYQLREFLQCRNSYANTNGGGATFDFMGNKFGLVVGAAYGNEVSVVPQGQSFRATDSYYLLFESPWPKQPGRLNVHTECIYPIGA